MKPCVNEANVHHCSLCGLAVPGKNPDLKAVLMHLGNKLVLEHRFAPSVGPIAHPPSVQSTNLITQFTQFMNQHPEAREVLKELGFDWSM